MTKGHGSWLCQAVLLWHHIRIAYFINRTNALRQPLGCAVRLECELETRRSCPCPVVRAVLILTSSDVLCRIELCVRFAQQANDTGNIWHTFVTILQHANIAGSLFSLILLLAVLCLFGVNSLDHCHGEWQEQHPLECSRNNSNNMAEGVLPFGLALCSDHSTIDEPALR